MKSQVNGLLTVSLGLLKDVQVSYPSYGKVSKDSERLTHMSKTRGLGFYSLDLPNLDSVLTNGLETGRLVPLGPLSKSVSKKIKVPKFLSGLWLRVFDNECVLRHDADPTAIAFLRQFFCLGKKMVASCTPDRIKDTIDEYHSIESGLRSPTLGWDEDSIDDYLSSHCLHFRDGVDADLPLFPRGNTPTGFGRLNAILSRFQRFCDEFAREIRFFEPIRESNSRYENGEGIGFKHGPGAVADQSISRGANKYHFLNWPAKLQTWFPFEECGIFNSAATYQVGQHEAPSKLICVPKSAKAPRLIAAEPTQYMWTQKLVQDFTEKEIYRIFKGSIINFRDQQGSRDLACLASLTGDMATVDLSSASDRLSCWVVERAFRKAPSFLCALHATRTRWTVDRISQPPIFFKKKKFASQGTAVTFPVQTIIYALAALASLPGGNLQSTRRKYQKQVRVFGDDIIMPTIGYDNLTLLLDYLQLKVNKDKSFKSGAFRESCGFDAFRGYDVTPVKPKSLEIDGPQSRASFIDFTNNLWKKGFWNASKAAESIAGRSFFMRNLPVLGRDCDGRGLTSFVGTKLDHLRSRWNSQLQREEVRVHDISSRVSLKQTDDISSLFQFITENPSPLLDWASGIAGKPKCSDTLRWVPTYVYN